MFHPFRHFMLLGFGIFLAVMVLGTPARAQTVTVTTAADDIDIDSYNGTIDDLPGPDGKVSFSEAMIATNNTPGHQTVGFAIPQNEWILQYVLPGRADDGRIRALEQHILQDDRISLVPLRLPPGV